MMSQRKVYIVRTGVANTASVMAAFRRLGAAPEITDDASVVESASRVVLPGVGSFGSAMERLSASKMVAPLRSRIESNQPTLAVCLGFQLLARSSEESPDATGLGIVDAKVQRFREVERIPQFGWNRVAPRNGCRLLEDGYAYFANSYCLTTVPDGWEAAQTTYGGSFVSALERGNVLACQFHPELSGAWGMSLLRRWLEQEAS